MRLLARFFCLAILASSLVVIQEAGLSANEGCTFLEFYEDCNNADNAAWAACEDACWRQFMLPIQYYGGGTCHWYGENDPGMCFEDWGEDCGCFSYYSYGQCYCDGL